MAHIHIHVRRWVLWWFYVGIVCGAVAVVNILFRDLTRMQDKIILVVGIVHWVLGGIVCWASDGIKMVPSPPERRPIARAEEDREWHSPSEFLIPGGRKSLLPPRF